MLLARQILTEGLVTRAGGKGLGVLLWGGNALQMLAFLWWSLLI